MTRQEFETRTGLTPTEGEFENITALYLAVTMGKDDFCKDFKKHGKSTLLWDLFNSYKMNHSLKDLYKEKFRALVVRVLRLDDGRDTWRDLVNLLGIAEIIKIKIENDLPLHQDEKDYILKNLK